MLHDRFLDIRNHGCRRAAVIVPRVHVADPAKNAEEHVKMLDAAYADGAQLAVCPELGLTGYSCKDLFRDETLRASALEALEAIRARSLRWPEMLVLDTISRYAAARDIVWLQEEPENMGPWNFVKGRLYERFEGTHSIHRVSRYESGSPATGSHAVHAQEQAQLLAAALDL